MFSNEGRILFDLGFMKIHCETLTYGLFLTSRLVAVILVAKLITATTNLSEFTLGLESLLSPLAKLNFPVAEIVLVITISFRFVPTLRNEAHKVLKAQAARGVDIKDAKLHEKLTQFVSLLVPLFMQAFVRADDLANAMEARGYHLGTKRTNFKTLTWQAKDTLLLTSVSTLLASVIIL